MDFGMATMCHLHTFTLHRLVAAACPGRVAQMRGSSFTTGIVRAAFAAVSFSTGARSDQIVQMRVRSGSSSTVAQTVRRSVPISISICGLATMFRNQSGSFVLPCAVAKMYMESPFSSVRIGVM